MSTLAEFIKWFNLCQPDIVEYSRQNVKTMSADIADKFVENFVEPAEREEIGMSELGKPAVLLALKKLGYKEDGPTVARRMNMFWGHCFEAGLVALMRDRGYMVSHTQSLIDFMGVPGHIDLMLSGLVVEIKTMSDRYFRQFSTKPDDERGYLTQMALYSHCSDAPGLWLIYNKEAKVHSDDTPLRAVYPAESDLEAARNRAEMVVSALKEVNDLQDLFEIMTPPDPVAEVFKGSPTGDYLVPPSMKYTSHKRAFYWIEEGVNKYRKPQEYVVGLKTLDEAVQELLF